MADVLGTGKPRVAACVGPRVRRSVGWGCDRGGGRRHQGEAGVGLVEALVALLIAGSVILAIAGGLVTVLRATDSNAQRQELHTALANYAERLKAAPYIECADPVDPDGYAGVPFTPPAGIEVSLDSVEYWEKLAPGEGPGGWRPTCPEPDEGAQLLSVSATMGDRAERVEFVKAQR